MTKGKRNIIQQLLQEYDIETAEDIQEALKDLLGGTIKEMMVTIWDTKNLSAQTVKIIVTDAKQSRFIPVMALWIFRFRRTE